MTFEEHCIAAAREFLQTALVIDDRAALGDEAEYMDEPKTAVLEERAPLRRRSRSTDASASEGERTRHSDRNEHRSTSGAAPAPDAAGATKRVELTREVGDGALPAARLNAKALTDAFLTHEVICGVHKPTAGEASVPLAITAAKRADIVVVDWYLENNSSVKAKAIVKGVLKEDVKERGRLRLVAIYTSEPGRAVVAEELWATLQEDEELRDRLTLDETALCSADTRICIVNKEGTLAGSDLLRVPESDLPEYLLREFAKLTDGLLANFAVSAVAAVRRGAHHVLARFRKELDGAYLAHRISQKNPGDAEDMVLERVSIELSSLVENADVPGRTLRTPAIEAWLESRASGGHVFKNASARIPLEVMKQLAERGATLLAAGTGQEQIGAAAPPKSGKVSKKTILNVFYTDHIAAAKAAREFARLTSYKREVGRVRLDDFKPRLTLGALLKVCRGADGPQSDEIEGDFLLCVQPRCDSLRFETPRAFPFQQAKYDPNKFNLIVDGEGSAGYLLLDTKPMSTVMLKFQPKEGKDAIFAQKHGDSYLFTDVQGRQFEWIGDLDDLKAQRLASEIGASMHRVGVDELEWLRLGADGTIKPEAQQQPAAEDGAKMIEE